MEDIVLNKQELADFLKVELKTINYYLYSKQIPRFKCGREYRFLKSEIMKWINNKIVREIGSIKY
ncbi:helix-turn-helix domain-containing protein [Candidatus Margulisiibacteriota bacterium]